MTRQNIYIVQWLVFYKAFSTLPASKSIPLLEKLAFKLPLTPKSEKSIYHTTHDIRCKADFKTLFCLRKQFWWERRLPETLNLLGKNGSMAPGSPRGPRGWLFVDCLDHFRTFSPWVAFKKRVTCFARDCARASVLSSILRTVSDS